MIEASVTMSRRQFTLNAEIRCSGLTGLTGANGSGKTTFLHILTGLYSPDNGSILLNGRDITDLPVQERSVVYLNPDTYFGHMTVDRHLRWGMAKRDSEKYGEVVSRIKEELGINFSGRLSALSVGQRARVILGTALVANPELIILDELLSNVSGRQTILKYLSRLSGKSFPDIIFVSQEENDLDLAGHVYRMVEGRSEHVR